MDHFYDVPPTSIVEKKHMKTSISQKNENDETEKNLKFQ